MNKNMHIENPCKRECAERSPTCHAHCEKYLAWVESRQPELKAKAQQQIAEGNYIDHVNARAERLKRFRRKTNK